MKKNAIINIRIDSELKNSFESIASADNFTVSEVITASIKDIVKRGFIPIKIRSSLRNKPQAIITLPFIKVSLDKVINESFNGKLESVSVFGSYSRGEATSKSDVDLYLETKEGFTALDLIKLQTELEKTLGKKTDLVTKGGLSDAVLRNINREKIQLYEAR